MVSSEWLLVINLGYPKYQKYRHGPVTMPSVVRASNLEIGFDTSNPLLHISELEVNPGEVVSIAGPSGIGKTSILRTIAGLLSPISGSVEVCGSMLPARPERGSVGYIPQRLGLVRHSSVLSNVMLGSRAGNVRQNWKGNAIIAIEEMGLLEKKNEVIKRLSGGQQRRVATARTLAQRPKLILADEFLSELDEKTIERVLNSTLSYIKSSGAAMILVEHDVTRAKEISDRLLVIDDGRLNPFISNTSVMEV